MKENNSKKAVTLAFLVLVQLVISSAAPLVSPFFESYYKVAAVKLIYAMSFVVPYIFWKRMFRPIGLSNSKHTYCEYKKPAFFVAFAAIVAFLQINIVLLEVFNVTSSSSGSGVFNGFFGFLFSLLMYAVIPAITEELFSRGVIMRICGGGYNAAIVSGVIFGVCHFNPYQLVYAVGSGIVISFLYLYTSDMRLAVYLHLCVNTVVLMLSYLAKICPVGVYVAIECVVWLTVLALGIYYSYVILRDYQIQVQQRTKKIRKNKEDILPAEIFSPVMLVVYAVIIAATVFRYL